ncbi:hypothetical protein ACFFGH_23325 [Lysobacter korlensis]|uniref:Transcriptional regulator, AbiEi antitoxin, Type IV TA system n=1 Tax=Lysobacter korlensis TaxID=553636 RepID=A0ABV6RWF8_9GAMM
MIDVAGHRRAWQDEFVRAADMRKVGHRSDLVRGVRTGSLVPVCRGIYRRAGFASEDDDDRYLALLRGTQLAARTDLVFVQMSAARIWQLPIIGQWPRTVHVTDERRDGSRSTAGLVRHNWGLPDVSVDLNGLRVTPLVKTVIDVARCAPFEVGVAMADAALHGLRTRSTGGWLRAPLPRPALEDEIARLTGARGCVRAREVVAFADARSESAGESLSRVNIRWLGFPAPVLQQEFHDRRGRMIVDFWWPQFNLVGEFDGHGKYLREEYTRGRSTADIVLAEKQREDRLRALGPRVTRWDWEVARSLPLLREHLSGAGLRTA